MNRDTLVRLLQQAVSAGATEVHLKVPAPPQLRLEGRLVPTRLPPLRPADVLEGIQQLCMLSNREVTLAATQDLDLAFGLPGMGRFLVTIYRQRGSLAATIRRVDPCPPTLADLSLGGEVAELAGHPGLVLVAGRRRAELLHALVSEYNANVRGHVVVLESPLCYLHRDSAATVAQREIGVDCASYEDGVRSALHSRADLLVLGILETPAAVEAALTAAERGMPILAGVDAPDAELARWWVTRMFTGEQRDTVERRLDLVLSRTVALLSSSASELRHHEPTLRRAV